MKKTALWLMVLLFVFGVYTVCSGKTQTRLTLWHYYETDAQKMMIKKLTEGFNASQPDIKISDQYVPYADFTKQLSIGLAAEKLPDIVIINNPDHASYAKMGLFADITRYLRGWKDQKEYFPGPWKSTMLDGKNYGIPFVSNCLALFYNVEMLEKAGVAPPKTWDELRAAAKKLTTAETAGFGIAAANREEGTFQFIPFLYSAGASYDKLDSPAAIKAVSFITDLYKSGAMSKECINWGQSDLCKQFMVGKVAMMVNGPWQMPRIQKEAPNLKYDVVLLPKDKQSASCLGGENIGVVKNKNSAASVKFLKYIGQPQIVKQYALDYGAFPPRRDVGVDKAFSNTPQEKVFLQALEIAVPRGPHPKWPQYSKIISTMVQESLTGMKTSEAAAKDAQALINQIK